MFRLTKLRAPIAVLLFASRVCAQVYSPWVVKEGQPDTGNLPSLALSVFKQAEARTDREKAEAIWRFFLTDGRFVKPGILYHIAGWAYEEPVGEVLDPIKLLNSYGFGLCYHIAPLLESVFKAGGFQDARVWFLTGHTVAEVFYEGGYHYFDSDMMGYNPIGSDGPVKERPVASVHQIELDGSIMTGKLAGPKQTDVRDADSPWYPADVRAHAIGDLAELFTSTHDNWVYPFQRYQAGHTMDFVLRPGERLTRYFRPELEGLSYLPYRFDGTSWREFPQELAQYRIRTVDGPQSQKDPRHWATGVQQYRPPGVITGTAVFAMPCPYVIIDSHFAMNAKLHEAADSVTVETSTDAGQTWTEAAALSGPHQGTWSAVPAVLTKSEHGSRNAVSGTYGYWVRIKSTGAPVSDLVLTTRFQLNPRTLPEVAAGTNEFTFTSGDASRWELPALQPNSRRNIELVTTAGQSYMANRGTAEGEIVFALEAPDGGEIDGFDAGARFLDLRDGLAPDKFTAEVRKVTAWPAKGEPHKASISWSVTADGPFETLWAYDPKLKWRDAVPIDRTLRWPEADRQIRKLPEGTRKVYVRYGLQGMGADALRMAAVRSGLRSQSPIQITHKWLEDGAPRERVVRVEPGQVQSKYQIRTAPNVIVVNDAMTLEIAPVKR